MSTIKAETTQPACPKKSVKTLLQDARIDAAHPLNAQDSEATGATSTDSAIADSVENAPVLAVNESPKDDFSNEQLQRQAEQLAHYLRDRQNELDHREAQLNAEIAQVESDLRNARMWIAEREAEQEQRRGELDIREKEFLERLERLAAADAALKRQVLPELEKKRRILQRRSDHVDRRHVALLQLRAELQQMHRETLEIRLAAEELWTKLSGAAPPAALTHSLARIRGRLADQYRHANAELIERKKELESIRHQLVEQYEKLVEQKRQFERSMAVRQRESQRQASMLIARQSEG